LSFEILAEGLAQFTGFAGQVILGLIIFAIGLYLANLVSTTVRASDAPNAGLLALAARIAILVLAGAMALRQMGLANEIVNLAFGLLLGAIAVAVALAFGLGGRDIAARELEGWLESIKSLDAAD
jgi:predicted permease